jgi:hypothetical protein
MITWENPHVFPDGKVLGADGAAEVVFRGAAIGFGSGLICADDGWGVRLTSGGHFRLGHRA